jgi:serine/threonine-protein kinase
MTPLTLALPRGVVNLNATPWAEVWIDGQRVGETPIGNLSVTIGAHEIVFRHPQLGEKRHAVSVTAGAPVRLSVDMK